MDQRLEVRKQEMEAALGRSLSPIVQDSPTPLSEVDLRFMVDQAEDLFWNELEWEHITAEEQIPGGMFIEQAFPGFLALVRGLLLAEVMPDSLAEATPRPRVVRAILAFLLQEVDRFRERLPAEPDDTVRIEMEIAMTEGLIDLVLATLFGLVAEDIDRLAEARSGADPAGSGRPLRRRSVFGFPRRRPGHPYMAGAPLLIAHRGGAHLAPENTMAAFLQAVNIFGADMLEMDVHATSDGRVVVIHDPTLDRTTHGTGAVAELPWDRIREFDAGFNFLDLAGEPSSRGRGVAVPLFEEVLEALPHTRINVEAKVPGVARALADLVLRHGAQHRVLIAVDREPTRASILDYPGPRGASRRQMTRFFLAQRLGVLGRAYTPDADALQIPDAWQGRQVASARFIQEAHLRNLPVHVWTVDRPDDMRRLLSWGADGIQSDRPDLLARVLHSEETGRPLPPGAGGEG